MADLARHAVGARRRAEHGPLGTSQRSPLFDGLLGMQASISELLSDDAWDSFVQAARQIDGRDGAPMVWPHVHGNVWVPPDRLLRMPRKRQLPGQWVVEPNDPVPVGRLVDAMRVVLASSKGLGRFDGFPINDLDSLPEDVKDGIRGLHSVSLSGTPLRSVPAWLLRGKKRVDLSFTPLETLPELPDPVEDRSAGGAAQAILREDLSLNLAGTLVADLPASWAPRRMTQGSLNLSGCPLHAASFANLPKLMDLIVVDSGLLDVPAFRHAPSRLHLSGNHLGAFPEALREVIGEIVLLDLSSNHVCEIPQWIEDASSLAILRLRGNHIAAIHASLSALPWLSELDLGENRIVIVAEHAFRDRSLGRIRLDRNELGSLPPLMWPTEELDLSGNPLVELPRAVDAEDCCLERLLLGGTDLVALPSIPSLPQLRELHLPHDRLGSLPPELVECVQLWQLVLPGMSQDRYPSDLSRLEQLYRLDIRGPALSAIPGFVASLGGLMELRLEDVSLVVIPERLACWRNRIELTVDRAPLRCIEPGVLNKLRRLAVRRVPMLEPLRFAAGCGLHSLEISGCGVVRIDPSIANCLGLVELDLGATEFAWLPDEVAGLPALKTIISGTSEHWVRQRARMQSIRPDIHWVMNYDRRGDQL